MTVGLLACVAGAGVVAFRIHRPFEDAGGGSNGLAARSSGTAPAGAVSSLPRQIRVSVAQLSDVPADVPAAQPLVSQQPAIAQLGSLDSIPGNPAMGATQGGKMEDDQSDAELSGTFAEPTHTVAPVPVQDQSQAAVKVALAAIGVNGAFKAAPLATIRAAGKASGVRMAIVVYSGRQIADRRIGDLRDQVRVAHWQQRVFVPSASLGVPFDPDVSSIAAETLPRGWPLADESPIADPAVLVASLGGHDPLRAVARRWEVGATTGEADALSQAMPDVDRAIAGSGAPWQIVYEMGRDSAFFDAPSRQRAFWRAAVMRAAASPSNRPISRHDLGSMRVLAGTFLWIWKDDITAASALRTLMKWQKRNSPGAGQAALLLTSILDRQGNQEGNQAGASVNNFVGN